MNLFQQFLAKRAAKGVVSGNGTPINNATAPVTRAEFNTLAKVVNGLVEDFDTVTSPDKIAAVLNEAVAEAARGITPTTVNARAHLAPGAVDPVVPARSTRKAPLANADRSRLAPKGE